MPVLEKKQHVKYQMKFVFVLVYWNSTSLQTKAAMYIHMCKLYSYFTYICMYVNVYISVYVYCVYICIIYVSALAYVAHAKGTCALPTLFMQFGHN